MIEDASPSMAETRELILKSVIGELRSDCWGGLPFFFTNRDPQNRRARWNGRGRDADIGVTRLRLRVYIWREPVRVRWALIERDPDFMTPDIIRRFWNFHRAGAVSRAGHALWLTEMQFLGTTGRRCENRIPFNNAAAVGLPILL